MSHLWELLEDVKDRVEVIQAPTARRARELLGERAVPALLLIEDNHIDEQEFGALTSLAKKRSVPWLVAALSPDPERELEVLSGGAIEYLAANAKDPRITQARLRRLLEDRFHFATRARLGPVDHLTGLPTRRILLERMEKEWARSESRGRPLSLILLSLDRFKAYNKAHGYLSGDSVLTDLAERFRQEVSGPGRCLARFGGDEFGLLLPGMNQKQATEISRRMKEIVREAGVKHRIGATDGIVTASIGVTQAIPQPGNSVYELVDRADRALREEKHQRQKG